MTDRKSTIYARVATNPEPGTRGAIYTRTARDTGADEQRQLAEIEAYAKGHGLTVTAVHSDNDVSASAYARKQRPAYQEMLHQIEAGEIDAVITYDLSRLTRSMADLADLIDRTKRAGVKVVTVADPAVDLSTEDGRLLARMIISILESESDRVSERIKAGKRAAAERLPATQRGRITALGELVCDWPHPLSDAEITELAGELRAWLTRAPDDEE